jgi:hypothetical protein
VTLRSSSTAVPPGKCLIHGPFDPKRNAICPRCTSSVSPDAFQTQPPPPMEQAQFVVQDPAEYWHQQFLLALSGLSWAVGKLGDEAGYAGVVHERLTHPTITLRGPEVNPG